MTTVYGSLGSFGSSVRSKSIGNNTNIGRISNFRSKSTPIHESEQKSDLNYSYSRSHFIMLPQAVSKSQNFVCLIKLVMLLLKLIQLSMDLVPMKYAVIFIYVINQSLNLVFEDYDQDFQTLLMLIV